MVLPTFKRRQDPNIGNDALSSGKTIGLMTNIVFFIAGGLTLKTIGGALNQESAVPPTATVTPVVHKNITGDGGRDIRHAHILNELENNLLHNDETKQIKLGSLPMAKEGKYEIFQPIFGSSSVDANFENKHLFASPKAFLRTFEERISWVDTMVTKPSEMMEKTTEEHAQFMYIEMLKSFVSASVFNNAELQVHPMLGRAKRHTLAFDLEKRKGGNDWTYAGDTMTGWKRLDNVYNLLSSVIKDRIEGDYIETGVWRGGSSILAKGVSNVLDPNSNRKFYVCDSFQGLPPGDKNLDREDKNWDNTPYLEIPASVVANNFAKYGLLDSDVVFAKGFFNETMPPLSKMIDKLSIMRLDGDMYESTVDVLYNLYDKLQIGGYVIMDDWFGFPSRTACEDFFAVHNINPEIIKIDDLSAYWKKTEDVNIQYWRYEQMKFKPSDVKQE